MRAIHGLSRNPAVSGIELPVGRGREQVLLTGPKQSCVVISDIDDEEAAEWDRIVALRNGGTC
jgi:hypothetical protein